MNAIGLASQAPLRRFAVAGVSAVLLLGLAYTAADAFDHDRTLTKTDTRSVARRWIRANLPPGVRVTKEFYTPALGPPFDVKAYFGLYLADYRDVVCGADYVVASSGIYGRYFANPDAYPKRTAFYEQLLQLPAVQTFDAAPGQVGPRIVVLRVTAADCARAKR